MHLDFEIYSVINLVFNFNHLNFKAHVAAPSSGSLEIMQ